eukprot:c40649_g1_i1 orf=324-1322(-)
MVMNVKACSPLDGPKVFALLVVTMLSIATSLAGAAQASKPYGEGASPTTFSPPYYYGSPYNRSPPYTGSPPYNGSPYYSPPYTYGSPYYSPPYTYGSPYYSPPYSYGNPYYNSPPYYYSPSPYSSGNPYYSPPYYYSPSPYNSGYPYYSPPYYYSSSPYSSGYPYYSPSPYYQSPYYYNSQSSPPSSPRSPTSKYAASTPPAYRPYSTGRATVTGLVYCDLCRDGNHKKPLMGVKVAVSCMDGSKVSSFNGITDEKGQFRIQMDRYNYPRWGGRNCMTKLTEAPSSCSIRTGLLTGEYGAPLHLKSKSKDTVVLEAGPFSYVSEKPSDNCHN